MIRGGLVLCDYPPLCIPYFNTALESSYNLAIAFSFSAFEQMGAASSKGYTRANDKPKNLRRTIRLLEKEVMELRSKKQGQGIAYEHKEVMLFTAKEAGWKRERKMWAEQMEEMRKQLEEKDKKIRRVEEELLIMDGNGGKEWNYLLEVGVLLEQMQEEQALRQEAVEKWKGLYLAIKSELDDLIQRTRQGERTSLGTEVEKLQRKLKAREERVADLRSRLVMKEKEAVEKQREVDILRQRLQIISDKKKAQTSHSFSGSLHCCKS